MYRNVKSLQGLSISDFANTQPPYLQCPAHVLKIKHPQATKVNYDPVLQQVAENTIPLGFCPHFTGNDFHASYYGCSVITV